MGDLPENHPSVFIQFAGQGVKYMEDLRRLYSMYPDIRPFIHDAVSEIKKQAAEYDDSGSGFFKYGIDVDRWIEHPEQTPDLGYLLSSPLSHPLIYLCQMANYISVLQEGLDQEVLLTHTHSATGFSTGVVAAILVSMGLPIDELCRLALKVQGMFFWQGVRTQQAMLNQGVSQELKPELYDSAEGSPSCMASVNNLMRKKLDLAIEQYSPNGRIYPAYELLPGRWIVSGHPEDLAGFNAFLKKHCPASVWRYIPSTIGAHSPFLEYALETSPLDAERLGVLFSGADMKIPVWSNDTGEDLRECNDIIQDVMRAYFVCPAVWRKQIASLIPPTNIKYVLDFGPGPGVASLTENHTARSGIQVLRCTNALGRKRLFEEVVPEFENTTGVN